MTQIVRTDVRKRGFFGKMVKALFIVFNILMIVWLFSYWVQAGNIINGASDHHFKTGAEIGTTLGTTFIVFFWALGDIILGLFVLLTRGKKLIIEETTQ